MGAKGPSWAACGAVTSWLLVWVVCMAGCGGDGGVLVQGDVPLLVTIDSTTPNEVSSVTIEATEPGDTLDVSGAAARVVRADGSSGGVTLAGNPGGTRVTLGRATVLPSELASGDAAADAGAQAGADVPLVVTIDADTPGEITSVTLTTVEPGDTLDISDATASVWSPFTETPVPMSANAAGTQVTVGPAPLDVEAAIYWMGEHAILFDGPIRVRDGSSGTESLVGHLGILFKVTVAGVAVLPRTVSASIPTLGAAADGRVVFDGLPEGVNVYVQIRDGIGGYILSRLYTAPASGRVVVPDTLGRMTAEVLSGPGSRIVLQIWDGWFYWSPYRPPPPSPPGPPGPPPAIDDPSLDALNRIVLDGPIAIRDGGSERAIELGHLRFLFEVLPDGTVVAPATIRLSVPVAGAARDQSVHVAGLEPGDWVKAEFRADSMYGVGSAAYRADAAGNATVLGAQHSLAGADMSGPNARISVFFTRSDTNGDGIPGLF